MYLETSTWEAEHNLCTPPRSFLWAFHPILWKLYVLSTYCVHLSIGNLLWGSLGAVRGSHLGSASSVSSVLLEAGWLAGSGGSARSLISITSLHRCRRRCCCCRCHCLLPFSSPLLLSSSSIPPLLWEPVSTNRPFILQFTLCFYLSVRLLPASPCTFLSVPSWFSNSHAQTAQQRTSRQCRLCYEWHPLAHPEEVYAPVWLCLHCPGNDSLNTAENGSQPDSQTDRQHSANRQTRLQSLPTSSAGKTDREADSLWQIQLAYNKGRQLANSGEAYN